jgi:cullin-4
MESEILGKLKAECGEDYTKNLESMINDIRVSSEMATDFMVNIEKQTIDIK